MAAKRLVEARATKNQIPRQVLGLGPNASEAEIRKAYKSLCLAHHPDKHAAGTAEARLGRLRMLGAAPVSWLIGNNRIVSEAAGAAVGVFVFRGAAGRAVWGGVLGALGGHGVARVACDSDALLPRE